MKRKNKDHKILRKISEMPRLHVHITCRIPEVHPLPVPTNLALRPSRPAPSFLSPIAQASWQVLEKVVSVVTKLGWAGGAFLPH